MQVTQDLTGIVCQSTHERRQGWVTGCRQSQWQGVGKETEGLFVDGILAVVKRHANEQIDLTCDPRQVGGEEKENGQSGRQTVAGHRLQKGFPLRRGCGPPVVDRRGKGLKVRWRDGFCSAAVWKAFSPERLV